MTAATRVGGQGVRLDRQVGQRVDSRALRQQGANPRQRVRRVEQRTYRAGGQLAAEPLAEWSPVVLAERRRG